MKTIPVSIKREPARYDVKIERGLVTKAGLPEGFVITDTNLIREYADLIKTDDLFVIEAGEQSKSMQVYMEIARNLGNAKRIIAFGGGVVGDLAGFIASTYKRGVPLINVPTSLLAMVDSSIGGKNGVNLEGRKNYIGAFYQPEEVLIDLNFLDTLPWAEFENGKAEIIKYGAIKDEALLRRMQKGLSINDEDLEEIIVRCVNIKKHFAERDEKDRNIRHALNFGHTIAHAVEIPYGFSHGQAVSIGMVYELMARNISGMPCKEKIRQVENALKANRLPTCLPFGANIEKILELMKEDKKGALTFAFDENHCEVKINETDVIGALKE